MKRLEKKKQKIITVSFPLFSSSTSVSGSSEIENKKKSEFSYAVFFGLELELIFYRLYCGAIKREKTSFRDCGE